MVYSFVKARVKFNYNFVVGCISLKYIKKIKGGNIHAG